MREMSWCVFCMGHKDVEIKWYGSRSYVDQKYAVSLSEYVSDRR